MWKRIRSKRNYYPKTLNLTKLKMVLLKSSFVPCLLPWERLRCIGQKPLAGEFIRPLNNVKVRAGEGKSSKGVTVRMRPIDGCPLFVNYQISNVDGILLGSYPYLTRIFFQLDCRFEIIITDFRLSNWVEIYLLCRWKKCSGINTREHPDRRNIYVS